MIRRASEPFPPFFARGRDDIIGTISIILMQTIYWARFRYRKARISVRPAIRLKLRDQTLVPDGRLQIII